MISRDHIRRLPARLRRLAPRRRDDTGSVSVELILGYVPVMILVVLGLFAVARIVSAQIDVNSAAAAAARQASLAYSPAGARAGADDAVTASLVGRTLTCRDRTLTVDTGAMAPGGTIATRLSCTVTLADLSGLGLPGAVTVVGESTQPIDVYRGVP
jgi:Flp pilus assembly protein TadG